MFKTYQSSKITQFTACQAANFYFWKLKNHLFYKQDIVVTVFKFLKKSTTFLQAMSAFRLKMTVTPLSAMWFTGNYVYCTKTSIYSFCARDALQLQIPPEEFVFTSHCGTGNVGAPKIQVKRPRANFYLTGFTFFESKTQTEQY